MIGFLLGLFIGFFVGTILCAAIIAAARADRLAEQTYKKHKEELNNDRKPVSDIGYEDF